MTHLTAMTVAANYPENIRIEGMQHKESKRWASLMYLVRDGRIHSTLLSFDLSEKFDGWETEKEATDHMKTVAKTIVNRIEGYENGNV